MAPGICSCASGWTGERCDEGVVDDNLDCGSISYSSYRSISAHFQQVFVQLAAIMEIALHRNIVCAIVDGPVSNVMKVCKNYCFGIS